jgi:hypothetical protein
MTAKALTMLVASRSVSRRFSIVRLLSDKMEYRPVRAIAPPYKELQVAERFAPQCEFTGDVLILSQLASVEIPSSRCECDGRGNSDNGRRRVYVQFYRSRSYFPAVLSLQKAQKVERFKIGQCRAYSRCLSPTHAHAHRRSSDHLGKFGKSSPREGY